MSFVSIANPKVQILAECTPNDPAVIGFWNDLKATGTPLIEPSDNGHCLVTFVYRADASVENIVIVGGATGYGATDNRLERLGATDIWHKTYHWRNDTQTTYQFSINDRFDELAWPARITAAQPDPLNQQTLLIPRDDEDPDDTDSLFSVISLPGAVAPPFAGAAIQGECVLHRLTSTQLGNERRVWCYLPPGYSTAAQPYGACVLLDGMFYAQGINVPALLDQLIAEQIIPPLVVMMIGNPSKALRSRELYGDLGFAAALATEFIPWLRSTYHISTEPRQMIVGGASYGGLTAGIAALTHPEVIGGVLAQSGAFGWKPADEAEHAWFLRTMATLPTPPLRWYLSVGRYETWL